MKRRIKILGKTISGTTLAFLLMTVIGSATLLTYYGTLVGTVTVEQSVKVDGHVKDVFQKLHDISLSNKRK